MSSSNCRTSGNPQPNRGFTGPTGPAGPPGDATSYANFYDVAPTTVLAAAALPLASSNGASNIANSSGVLTFAEAGLYTIDVSVRILPSGALPETTSVTAVKNGTTNLLASVLSDTLNDANEAMTMAGSFLFQAAAGDTLELRNTSAATRSLIGKLVAVKIAE